MKAHNRDHAVWTVKEINKRKGTIGGYLHNYHLIKCLQNTQIERNMSNE